MAGHATSERVKTIKHRHADNAKMQAAVAVYLKELAKPEGEHRKGARTVANEHSVNHHTLHDHAVGKHRPMSAYLESKQRLSAAEEHVVVDWIIESADRGIPQTHARIEATHWSRPLDTQRARALNPEVVRKWFELVRKEMIEMGVKPEHIYAMDESGFPAADQDGSTLTPLVVQKAKNFQSNWNENNVANVAFAMSESGWSSSAIAMRWMEIFEEETKEKANNGEDERVVYLDGHVSHLLPDLLKYTKDHNIKVMGYPPHCTHALQGLDVACFGKMKECWKIALQAFENEHRRGIRKCEFAEVWGKAYLEAFTPSNVRAAFSSTGIHPFNPDIISAAQMKPSETTALMGGAPIEQPSPVKAIVNAFRSYQPTSFEISTDTHLTRSTEKQADAVVPPQSKVNINSEAPATHMCLMTAKLAQTFRGSLLVSKPKHLTVAQSYVLTRPPVLDCRHLALAVPKWPNFLEGQSSNMPSKQSQASLAEENKQLHQVLAIAKIHIELRNKVIEGSAAQLVLQGMTLDHMQSSLEAKEKKLSAKQDEKIVLFSGGNGIVLTSNEFMAKVAERKARVEQKAAEKSARKTEKQCRQQKKTREEKAWKDACAQHDKEVALWRDVVDDLTARRVKKKELPIKPKRPKKADVLRALTTDSGDEHAGDEHTEFVDLDAGLSDIEEEDDIDSDSNH
ncbi:DDE-domain-containing protein [Fistulina hepatica ATCC 64428]|uniref:DDE-domain-containing protein n=1 Tax=Fistulina hepatica ATCC 64428 TaxID=1128425 RepID=A0A0D7A1H8_9AGAR|nr:DDE-domain-containing protein [Fistulina hepatica ATCC 64428]